MAFDTITLFRLAGIGIDEGGRPNIPPGMVEWIGRITSIPRELLGFGLRLGSEVWQVSPGFARFEQSGFERWLVDAPKGDNLLISLREIAFDHLALSVQSDSGICIWNNEQLSTFLGTALLKGCIPLGDEQDEEMIQEQKNDSELDRWIDSGSVMIGNLQSGIGKPRLKPIGLWAIKGNLTCDEEEEYAEWLVVDEGDGMRLLSPSEVFITPPKLEHLSKAALSIAERNQQLQQLLSESRRMNSSTDGNLSEMRKWEFNPLTAEIVSIECFTPEWV